MAIPVLIISALISPACLAAAVTLMQLCSRLPAWQVHWRVAALLATACQCPGSVVMTVQMLQLPVKQVD